jgi:hypothetical protein
MATGNFILDKGYRVAAGQTATKFRACKFSAAETVTPVTGIADRIAGFHQYSVSAAELLKGKGASVRRQGITEAEAAGAIAVGAQVTLEADGRVSNAVVASGKRIVGTCVGHPAAAAGDRISLEVDTNGPIMPAT